MDINMLEWIQESHKNMLYRWTKGIKSTLSKKVKK